MSVQASQTRTATIAENDGRSDQFNFERAVQSARERLPAENEASEPAFHMATDNEVWPPVEDITIVDVPSGAITDNKGNQDIVAYKAKGDTEITVIRRQDNPKFHDYIAGISRISSQDMEAAKDILTADSKSGVTNNEFVRNVDANAIKLGDVETLGEISDTMLFVNMRPGTDGAATRVVSRELTPELFDKLKAMHGAKQDGYQLVTDENGITDADLAAGASIYRPDEDNGIIRVDMTNGDKKFVSADTTQGLYDFLSGKSDEFSGPGRDQAVEDAREDAGLPSVGDLDIGSLQTTEKGGDGDALTVTELAWQTAVKSWKDGVENGSIGADDDRAKLLRAIQADAISQNGLDMATLSMANGNDIVHASNLDFDQIIDGNGIEASITELMSSEAVGKDLAAARAEAVKKIEGGDEAVKQLEDMAFGADYAKYIQDLIENGKSEVAQDDISSVYASLLVADSEKAKEFAQNMQINSMTMELDKLMGDPSLISEENLTQAGTDIVKMLLTIAKKGGLDIGRRLAESEKFLNEVLGNKQTAKDFAKAMQELGGIYSAKGTVTPDDIKALFKDGTYKSLSEMPGGGGLKFFNDMTKAGVIGSIGGGISLASGIYQLASKGGKIGDTHEERLAVAKDFVGFIGAGKHFADLAGNIIGDYNKDVKAYNDNIDKTHDPLEDTSQLKKKFTTPLIGLDKSLEELWYGAPSDKIGGGLTMSDELRNAVVDEVYKATGGTDKPDFYNKLLEASGAKGEDALIKGLENGYQKISPDIKWTDLDGKDISAGAWHRGASSALLILSAGADTFVGAADVAIGALTIEKGLQTGDDVSVAKGALQVAAGGFGTIGGLASVAGLSKALSLVKAVAAPSFVVSAVLSVATVIPDIINDIKRTEEIMAYKDGLRDLFQKLDQDGLLGENGLDKFRFLEAYLRSYGQRDAPDDQSILDYHQDELDNFLAYISEHRDIVDKNFTTEFGLFEGGHPDYDGDGPNLNSQLDY